MATGTTLLAEAQHFVQPPHWAWYILVYFFFAGLAGGSYFIAALLRLRGDRADEPAARVGSYVALASLPLCGAMLILDLGSPLRFWHMMWNTTPGAGGFVFKWWSPMSVGAWALLVFGAFATASFVHALVLDGKLRAGLAQRLVQPLDGGAGRVVMLVGGVLGLFIAGYTGVLLSVSNQPVWSDTWALGGLFLASGLSGSAALLHYLLRYRQDANASAAPLAVSERLYALLELALIVVFVVTLIPAGTLGLAFGLPWTLLWIVAFAGLLPGLRGLLSSRLAVTEQGVAVPVEASVATSVATPALVLVGVLALRAAVIFSVQ